MFDPLAVGFEYFELVFVVSVKVIVQCFPTDGADNGFVTIFSFEEDDHANRIVLCTGFGKNENAFV